MLRCSLTWCLQPTLLLSARRPSPSVCCARCERPACCPPTWPPAGRRPASPSSGSSAKRLLAWALPLAASLRQPRARCLDAPQHGQHAAVAAGAGRSESAVRGAVRRKARSRVRCGHNGSAAAHLLGSRLGPGRQAVSSRALAEGGWMLSCVCQRLGRGGAGGRWQRPPQGCAALCIAVRSRLVLVWRPCRQRPLRVDRVRPFARCTLHPCTFVAVRHRWSRPAVRQAAEQPALGCPSVLVKEGTTSSDPQARSSVSRSPPLSPVHAVPTLAGA